MHAALWPGHGGPPLSLRLSEGLDPAAQTQEHVYFIVECAAHHEGAGLLTEGLESY